MTEKLADAQFGFEEYLNLGGRWDEETFDELTDILANEEDPIPIRRIFLEQGEGIKKSSGIEITPKELYLYSLLREKSVENNLSDVRLMAEVILLNGNSAKRKLFESKYPYVDFSAMMQVLEPGQSGVRQITYRKDNNDIF